MSRPAKAGSPRPRHATALDVAKVAGVSRSAVSRTFTKGASVSPATRVKVLRAAKQLGYHRNALAMGMFHRRSGMFGVVTGSLENPFIAAGLDLLSRRLQHQGMRTLIYSGDDEQDLQLALPALAEYRIDGCFVLSNQLSPEAARHYVKLGIPLVVVFNSRLPGMARSKVAGPYGAVSVDNAQAGALVADFLVAKGRRRFAYVAGFEDAATSIDRERGFTDRLHHRGMANVARAVGEFSYEGGTRAARQLLSETTRPDAVFCANDSMAMAVIDTARSEFGLRIPADLAVVGFDDVPAAAYASYDLTTIRQPQADMIDAATDLMARLLSHQSTAFADVWLEGQLVERSST